MCPAQSSARAQGRLGTAFGSDRFALSSGFKVRSPNVRFAPSCGHSKYSIGATCRERDFVTVTFAYPRDRSRRRLRSFAPCIPDRSRVGPGTVTWRAERVACRALFSIIGRRTAIFDQDLNVSSVTRPVRRDSDFDGARCPGTPNRLKADSESVLKTY